MLERLLESIAGTQHEALRALADDCRAAAEAIRGRGSDERLAASYPFLTMLSVATTGWLMERQLAPLDGEYGAFESAKRAAINFYLNQIVPEARGFAASAVMPPRLYELPADAFAA